ncbi:MAG: hypothetical protein K6E83_11875 [Clostridium sp.]|nr:hypothetical protein [Clostridium sp.]
MLRLNAIEIVFPDSPAMLSLAEKLRKDLEAYRVPRAVVEKTGIRSVPDVTDPWLIVLCTPESPASPEVKEKIAAFTAAGNYHRILTLLADGLPEQSFPAELMVETLPDGSRAVREPLAANITAETERERAKKLSVEKLRLLAPILGVSFDELLNRRRRNQMRIAAAVSAVILLSAAAFSIYAFNRMQVIAGQNAALSEQFALAEKERDAAQEQRDAAREEFAGTTAIRAREVLDRGDCELAMLLCLEFLPESGQTTELPGILDEALHKICSQGYVPVTSVKEYAKTRYTRVEDKDKKEDEAEAGFPKTIAMPVPEEFDNGKETFELDLEVSSEEFGYAVYRGSFPRSRTSGGNVYRTRVCFRDEPERDHYLPFSEYNGEWAAADVILPDGTFIGTESAYSFCIYRYNPFTAEFLPFYDEAAEEQDKAPGITPEKRTITPLALQSDIKYFGTVEGAEGLVFGYTWYSSSTHNIGSADIKTYVFSEDPFRYLYTLDDTVILIRPLGSRYILGTARHGLTVFSTDPFEYRYTLENEPGLEFPTDHYSYETPVFADGRNLLYVNGDNGVKSVYDLDAGTRLSVISEPQLSYSMSISSEGLILSQIKSVPTLFRPEDGSVFGTISTEAMNSPELFGDYDEEAGRRSAMVIQVRGIVYEYREKELQVPEDLSGQAALAEELLNGRELTEAERDTFSLELEQGGSV